MANSPPFVCHACDIQCNSDVTLQQHNDSTKHKKKIIATLATANSSPQQKYCCKICQHNVNSPSSYQQHLSGPHQRRLNEVLAIVKAAGTQDVFIVPVPGQKNVFICRLCGGPDGKKLSGIEKAVPDHRTCQGHLKLFQEEQRILQGFGHSLPDLQTAQVSVDTHPFQQPSQPPFQPAPSQQQQYRCKICVVKKSKVSGTNNYKQHLNGSNHKSRLKEVLSLVQAAGTEDIFIVPVADEKNQFLCRLCDDLKLSGIEKAVPEHRNCLGHRNKLLDEEQVLLQQFDYQLPNLQNGKTKVSHQLVSPQVSELREKLSMVARHLPFDALMSAALGSGSNRPLSPRDVSRCRNSEELVMRLALAGFLHTMDHLLAPSNGDGRSSFQAAANILQQLNTST